MLGRETTQQLRDRIDELEEENRQLRALLVPRLVLPPECGLTAIEERFVSILLRQAPRVVRYDALHDSLYSGPNDAPGERIIHVMLNHIRKKLARFEVKITTVWGIGLYIDSGSRDRLQQMIENPDGESVTAKREIA